MLKYKKGDKVKVLTGRDKGREGAIEKIYPQKATAIVAGINIFKKHVKGQVAKDGKGGIYEIAKPIALSKLGIIDPKKGKVTRVRFEIKKGKKVRVTTVSGADLDSKRALPKVSKKTKK